MIYESNKVDKSTGINGKWYYVGFEQDLSYSDRWQIVDVEEIQLSSSDILTVDNP